MRTNINSHILKELKHFYMHIFLFTHVYSFIFEIITINVLIWQLDFSKLFKKHSY